MSATLTIGNARAVSTARCETARLTWFERGTLAVGIWEIPLQLDKYLMFRESDSELGALAGINISVTTVALVILYTAWLFRAAAHRARNRQPVILGIPMLAYVAFVALSILAASVPILAVFDLFLLVQAYALFFYLANRIHDRYDLVFCLMVLVVTLLTQSILVFGLAALGASAHGQRYDFGPLSLSVWADGRVAGTLVSAVVCGSVMAFLWVPTLALTLTLKHRHLWLLAFVTTGAGLLAVILTQTRGAILNIAIGGMIVGLPMLVRGWLPKWTIYAVLLGGLLCAYPLGRVVSDRVLGDDNGSAESRKHLSLIAVEMIKDHPIFGYGAGNCHLAAQKYADQSTYRAEWYYTIHCKYLLTWVETGIFGFVSFLVLLGNAFRYGIRSWNSSDRLLATLGLALTAGLAGTMLHMIVDIFNSRVQVQILWVVIGLLAAIYRAVCLNDNSTKTLGATPYVA